MSIASEITRINNNIAATYTALSAKGATLPATENSANLASTVATVPSGGSVDPRRLLFEVNNGVASKPAVTFNENSFAGVTSVDDNVLSSAYNRSNVNGDVSFPDLTTIGDAGLYNAFSSSGITSISFPSLSAIPDKVSGTVGRCENMCFQVDSLSSVNFPELVSVGSLGLQNLCYRGIVKIVNFPKLKTIGNKGLCSAFQLTNFRASTDNISFPSLESVGSQGLSNTFNSSSNSLSQFPKTVLFPSLTTIGSLGFQNCFRSCSFLETISFPSLTTVQADSFSNCFLSCTSVTEIHFPAAIQTDIEATTGYSTKWGASNATIYFDL